MTTTMTRDEVAKRDAVIALGIMALGLHQAEHSLPAPHAIDLPVGDEAPFIRVRVAGAGNQMRWLNTVHIDDTSTTELDNAGTHCTRCTWKVRLPDTGVQIELIGLRSSDTTALHLMAVSS